MKTKFTFLTQGIYSLLLSLSLSGAFAQTAQVWLTTGNESSKLAQQGSVTFGANSGSSTTINVNEGATYQTIDGYGFTLTQGSAKVIAGMSASAQSSLLNELFSTGGIGISVVRIGIGATDLSDWAYSYRDGAAFSLAGPDLTYTIPILKKILAINPSIKVLATPWSAPMWMKTNGSFTGGTLKAENYESYGQYWLDYMNAMKAQGINIWAITPQNEPLNSTNTPSMTLTKENQLGLINSYIGPKLRGAGYNCKIICYDHNCDNTEYPIYVANNSSYVDGAAFHLYAGSISALSTFRNSTGKNVYFTEQYTGAGGSFSGDLGWHSQNVTIGSMNNWSKIALEWNLATDPNYGPYIPGTCSTCKGAVTINGSSVTRNVAYYIIGQFSKFVRPNAIRIGATSNHGNLSTTAFRNSDGSKVAVVYNSSGSAVTFRIVWNNASFTYSLAGSSIVTFVWSGTSQPPTTGIVSGATYSVINVNSNKAMEVSGFSTVNGGNVQQWDYVGENSQKWRVTDVGGGAYSFINIHSGKGLDVAGVSADNGGNIQQWDYLGGNNQKWQILDNGDGTYRIISVHSGKSAEVSNFSTANGGNVQQWDYVSASSQKWRFTQLAAAREITSADDEASPSGFENTRLALSPNPAHAGVDQTISLMFDRDAGDIHVQLKDINGAEVTSRQYRGVKQQLDIPLPALARGMYLVRISGRKDTAVKKLMIK